MNWIAFRLRKKSEARQEMERLMGTGSPNVTLDQEINPWEAQNTRFDFAARKLNLDEGL